MVNLLHKKERSIQYYTQWQCSIVVLVAAGFIAIALAASITLVPTHIYINTLRNGDIVRSVVGGVESMGSKRQRTTKELKAAQVLIERLTQATSLQDAGVLLANALKTITGVSGVKVHSALMNINKGGDGYLLRVSGSAPRRDAVVRVRQTLEDMESITVVDFPIGNLAQKDGTYNFTIELTL